MIKYQYYLIYALIFLCGTVSAQQVLGDNMGNHKATKDLKVNNNDIIGVNILNSKGVVIGSATALGANIALRMDGINKALLVTRVPNLLNAATPSIPEAAAIDGMLVYDLTTNKFYARQSNVWVSFGSPSLASAQMLIGNAAGKAQAITITGDLTVSNTGVVRITNNSITTNKIMNESVIGTKIADSAIVTAKIADLAVTFSKLSSLSISTDKIVPGTTGQSLLTNASGNVAWESVTVGFGYSVGDIKPFIDLLGEGIPAGWVACNGQQLSDAASTLNGRLIPNLNNSTYMIGGAFAGSGVSSGSNTPNITAAQLPAITLPATSVTSESGGTPTGNPVVAQSGAHSFTYRDNYFAAGGSNYNNGSTTSSWPGQNRDAYQSSEWSTGTDHTHTATFSGNTLSAHAHTATVALNNTGAQTAFNIQPKSVVVTWIMRVK